jgi:hypothetical protein
LANGLGALTGVAWGVSACSRPNAVRWSLPAAGVALLLAASVWPLAVLADVVLQRCQLPYLASFEQPLELSRWTAQEGRISRVRSHATHGSWALRIDLDAGLFPGAALQWPWPDWSSYQDLLLDLALEDGPPLELVLKICDQQHNLEHDDRFHRTLRLVPGQQTFCVHLSDIASAPRGRKMNLHRIAFVQLFAVNLPSDRCVYVDNVRLR